MTHHLPTAGDARSALAPLVHDDLDEERATELFAIATWSHLVEPGDGIAGRVIAELGASSALAEVASGSSSSVVPESLGLTPTQWADARARWLPRLDQRAVFDSLRAAQRSEVRLLVPGDERWPGALDDLGDHGPVCLWVRGDVRVLKQPAAASIVGARAATGYGEHVATELSADLVGRGVAIVSGAAYGIDGSAHRAALSAGGVTIALLAGGVDRSYPAGHTRLIDQVAASGAVVSEVPCGSAPTKWRFLQRNRLIAALGNATVVVEAGWRSGSLNTAGHAAAMSRPIGAVPGPVTSAASAGCHRLLREFDARCVTNADEVMELWGGSPTTLFDMPDATAPSGRTDETTRVTDAMSVRSWRDASDIARRSGIAPDEVQGILGLMALEGAVVRGEGGWRRTSSGR